MPRQLKDYFLLSPKAFYKATRKDLCSSVIGCTSSGGGGVSTFNGRSGSVDLTTQDIVDALGYTPSPPNTDVVTMSGIVTTTDDTETSIITIPAATPGAYSFQVRAAATNQSTEAAYINIGALVMNNAGTLTMVGAPAYIFTPIATGGLGDSDITISTSGTNILIWVKGEVGITLNWKALVTLVAVN